MADLFDCDLDGVPEQDDIEAIPAGDYELILTESDIKTSRNGDKMLACVFQILSGDYANRLLWHNFNLWHPSEKAQLIAKQTLVSLNTACGFAIPVKDSEQLHNIPIIGRVKYKPAGKDKQGTEREASNEIKNFKALDGTVPMQQPAANEPQQNQKTETAPATTDQGEGPVWARGNTVQK